MLKTVHESEYSNLNLNSDFCNSPGARKLFSDLRLGEINPKLSGMTLGLRIGTKAGKTDSGALSILTRALGHKDKRVRDLAVSGFKHLKNFNYSNFIKNTEETARSVSRSAQLIVRIIICAESPDLRDKAFTKLEEILNPDPAFASLLGAVLCHGNSNERARALKLLGNMGEVGLPHILLDLSRFLNIAEERRKRGREFESDWISPRTYFGAGKQIQPIFETLESMGASAKDALPLLKLLTGQKAWSAELDWEICRALAEIGKTSPIEVLPVFKNMLSDPSRRECAVLSLKILGSQAEPILPALQEAFNKENNLYSKWEIIDAMIYIKPDRKNLLLAIGLIELYGKKDSADYSTDYMYRKNWTISGATAETLASSGTAGLEMLSAFLKSKACKLKGDLKFAIKKIIKNASKEVAKA